MSSGVGVGAGDGGDAASGAERDTMRRLFRDSLPMAQAMHSQVYLDAGGPQCAGSLHVQRWCVARTAWRAAVGGRDHVA